MQISVKHDLDKASKHLRLWERDQLPYASALGLTRIAKRAQTKVKRNIPRRFIMRKKWIQTGIRINPATKQQLWSRVYSRDDFMALQETGGIKRPQRRALSIPVGIRKDKQANITKAKRPAALLKKPNHFIAPISSGARQLGIFRTKGRAKRVTSGPHRGQKRKELELMYLFTPQSIVPARFGFERMITSAVRRYASREIPAAIEEALSSRKGY